ESLSGRLLGDTVLVRDLPTARELATNFPGFRYLTLSGELIELDGTLTVGQPQEEMGMLSRKSELLELTERLANADVEIAGMESAARDAQECMIGLDRQGEALQEQINVLSEQAADLRSRLTQHKERRDGLSDEVAIGRSEIGNIEQEIQSLDQSSMTASQQAETAEEQAQRLQAGLRNAECEIKEQERQRHRLLETLTTSKV